MKRLFDFIGTMFKTSIYVVCCLSLIGLSSCSNDDEGGRPTTGLVSPTVPSAGWSGSTDNGICTYRSDDINDKLSSYYAFTFENGICTDAVFNVVCENEAIAKKLSQILNSGEWAEEDDEDYSMSLLKNERNPILAQALHYSKAIKSVAKNTRAVAVNVMGITCTQEGKVVYFKVEAVKGLDGEDVKYVMKAWDTGLNINTLPARPIFGTWDEATGKYTSNSINAVPNTKVEIETAFDSSDILIKYIATFTLPNATWAEMIEESLREQAEGLKELGGIELEITRNGNIVSANNRNIEIAKTTKDYLIKMIVAMDILNARPIGTAIF